MTEGLLFDNITPTFEDQVARARTLPLSEVERHASASINNAHRCEECFCCACVTALERALQLTEGNDD